MMTNEVFNPLDLIAWIGGATVVGTGLVYLCGRFTFPHEISDFKVEPVVDSILNPVTTLGQMYRLYFNPGEKTFQTVEGKNVQTNIIGTNSKSVRGSRLDPELLPLSRLEKTVARSVRGVVKSLPLATNESYSGAEPYSVTSVLEEIMRGGEQLGAEAFSFNDSKMIHGDYVFNVLYHKVLS